MGVHFTLGQPVIPVGTDEASSLDVLDGAARFARGAPCRDTEAMEIAVLGKTQKVSTSSAPKDAGRDKSHSVCKPQPLI